MLKSELLGAFRVSSLERRSLRHVSAKYSNLIA